MKVNKPRYLSMNFLAVSLKKYIKDEIKKNLIARESIDATIKENTFILTKPDASVMTL